MPLTSEHDYTSLAGQAHVHHKCICAIPGLINQLDNIESGIDATSIVRQLYAATDDLDMIDKIIHRHGQRFLPGLLDYLSWEDINE